MISDYFDRKCTCVHAEILSCETATVHFTENQNAGYLVLTNKTQFNRYVSLASFQYTTIFQSEIKELAGMMVVAFSKW